MFEDWIGIKFGHFHSPSHLTVNENMMKSRGGEEGGEGGGGEELNYHNYVIRVIWL